MKLPAHQFGIDWTPLGEPPLIQRHQVCAYQNKGLGAFYHRRERIKAFWPKFEWHRWSERRLKAICDYRWVTWLGPASSTKSTDAGVFGLEYWLQAPDRTAVVVCSTTMKLLRMRIWSEIARHHAMLPAGMGNVGELIDSKTLIRWRQGDDKHGIFGMAVEEGPVDEVVNNLIGFHTQRVLLILDEMQGVREAIMKATFNMSTNAVFSFIGMGNPDSLMNPLGRESEPVDGWDSVVRAETEEWETHGGPTKGRGLCQFFNGLKSPADDSPEERKRLSFMINTELVEGILKGCRGNTNAPEYWQMAIGWPPPMGLESTLLDEATLTTFKCTARPVWTDGFVESAALDPAFNGGDKAILQFLRRGKYRDDQGERWQIAFGDWMEIPIDADSTRPIDHQIVDRVRVECEKRKIPPSEVACDASGRGGGLVSLFYTEWGRIVAVESGGAPSDLPINEQGKTAREAYDNRSSELCFSLREMAMANGIRGLGEDAAKQACARRTFYRNGKWCVEPKTGSKGRTDEKGRPVKGYKQRMGHSPDHMDACNIGVEHCRQKGVIPSLTGPGIERQDQNWTNMIRKMNTLYSEDNYAMADTA